MTTKNDIIDLPIEKIVAADMDLSKCTTTRTSGTTGIPFTRYLDRKANLLNFWYKTRYLLERGDKPSYRQVVLGDAAFGENYALKKIGMWKAKEISQLNDVGAQIKQIKEFDPRALQVTASCADQIANEVIEKDIKGFDIRLVFSAAEVCDDYTRKRVKKAFDAEVFDSYGSIEVGRIYEECVSHYGYHVAAEQAIVEITRDGEVLAVGEEGDVTITNLLRYVMPFIRYNQEDTGSLLAGNCPCGSCFPLMMLTEGRKKDRIKLPDGRAISAMVLINEMRYIDGIKQFQIIQESLNHFVIRVVGGRGFSNLVLDEVLRKARSILGDLAVNVEVADIILKGRTGKTRQFITKIQ
jgi:phenylacetate-CoA ligase